MTTYRELEDVSINELAVLFETLKTAGVSPRDLMSYALALDTIENQARLAVEEPKEEFTLEDCLEVNHEAEADDGEIVDDLYAGARLCLIKMDKLKAH